MLYTIAKGVGALAVEPTLVVIGVSYRTAALAVRERFWMDEAHRIQALNHLSRSEGVDEVVVVSTCNRTEFLIWTQNASEAANSVLRFLTRTYDLKLSDWSNFYRLVDEPAITHMFRMAAGLDTHVLGDPGIAVMLRSARELAHNQHTLGRFLNTIIREALDTANKVHKEAPLGASLLSVEKAVLRQCRDVYADLPQRSVLVIGAGLFGQAVAATLKEAGIRDIAIASRSLQDAQVAAGAVGARAVLFDQRATDLSNVDVLVAATNCPKILITRNELEFALRNRQERPMVVIDACVPRNIEASVRSLAHVCLFDIDDLCENIAYKVEPNGDTARAEHLVKAAASSFRRNLLTHSVVPTISALRERLEEICDQELTSLVEQYGPMTEDQDQAMRAYASHLTQRVTAMVGRHLSGTSSRRNEQWLEEAIGKLFDLPTDSATAANEKSSA